MSSYSDSSTSPEPRLEAYHAKTLNQGLLLSLIATLVKNPEADLMSFVPDSYTSQMEAHISNLLKCLIKTPSKCLVHSYFADSYERQRKKHLKAQIKPRRPREKIEVTESFSSLVDEAHPTSFKVVFPLSPSASALLPDGFGTAPSRRAVNNMKQIIAESDCLWTGIVRDFTAKLSDHLIVKVAPRSQSNHHIALECLEEHAPDIPAPRPHGLVRLGTVEILFMSYVPGRLLSEVWPTLTHGDKCSLQEELGDILSRLRTLSGEGRPFGTIDGLGIQDFRGVNEDTVLTAPAFENWFFSSRPLVSRPYVQLLEGLLHDQVSEQVSVFTHCDFRAGNIMIQRDGGGDWRVSAIFDWENAGFYPAYWEAVKSTQNLHPCGKDDWYLYLPECISPSTFALPWLVDHVLDVTVQRLLAWDRKPKSVQNRKK